MDYNMGENHYLIKYGYTLVRWCCMCRCSVEMMDHLLLHCTAAFNLWSFTFRSLGIQWVLPKGD